MLISISSGCFTQIPHLWPVKLWAPGRKRTTLGCSCPMSIGRPQTESGSLWSLSTWAVGWVFWIRQLSFFVHLIVSLRFFRYIHRNYYLFVKMPWLLCYIQRNYLWLFHYIYRNYYLFTKTVTLPLNTKNYLFTKTVTLHYIQKNICLQKLRDSFIIYT